MGVVGRGRVTEGHDSLRAGGGAGRPREETEEAQQTTNLFSSRRLLFMSLKVGRLVAANTRHKRYPVGKYYSVRVAGAFLVRRSDRSLVACGWKREETAAD